MNSDQFTPRFPFADWPNPDVPVVAAGVYAVWNDHELIYCGMSGREIDSKAAPRVAGDCGCNIWGNSCSKPALAKRIVAILHDFATTYGKIELNVMLGRF